jgi:hypothetical protein
MNITIRYNDSNVTYSMTKSLIDTTFDAVIKLQKSDDQNKIEMIESLRNQVTSIVNQTLDRLLLDEAVQDISISFDLTKFIGDVVDMLISATKEDSQDGTSPDGTSPNV